MKHKFIAAKIDLVNRKMSDLIGNDDCTIKAEVRILTSSIVGVREYAADDEDEIDPEMCAVYLASGEFFILHFPYSHLINILEWY
jgi:hypothetical protein